MATARASRSGVGAGSAAGAAASGAAAASGGGGAVGSSLGVASSGASDGLLPDPGEVAGRSPENAGDADDLLSQLAGEEIDRMLAEAQDGDGAAEPTRGRNKPTPSAAPATAPSAPAVAASAPAPSALRGMVTQATSVSADAQAPQKSDIADDIEREVIESVLREAGDALTQETADALRGVAPPDPLTEDRPAKVSPPATSAAKPEAPPLDDALADELDALFAELSKPEPATEKLLERMAAQASTAEHAPHASPAEAADETETTDATDTDPDAPTAAAGPGDDAAEVDAETQRLLDAVFDEATKVEVPIPGVAAPTEAEAEEDAEEETLPPPATADADAGLLGDLLKDVPSEPAADEVAEDETPGDVATDEAAAVEVAPEEGVAEELAAEDVSAEEVAPADVGGTPVAAEASAAAHATEADASHEVAVSGYKPTTHRGPPFLTASAEWRPDRPHEDNVLGRLADVEHDRARWLIAILEWINRPFDFLTPEVRTLLGWAAIITLFNALVVLVYVAMFKQ